MAAGIVVVYILTMIMVPNLTILLDLKKPSHPPPKVFVAVVNMPVKWSRITLALFIALMVISAGYNRQNVEENIDLLEMAPSEVEAVQRWVFTRMSLKQANLGPYLSMQTSRLNLRSD